jgi:GMP synthase-like glutamine amidotransferase
MKPVLLVVNFNREEFETSSKRFTQNLACQVNNLGHPLTVACIDDVTFPVSTQPYSHMIWSGSSFCFSEDEVDSRHIHRLQELYTSCSKHRTPLLAICFGFQALMFLNSGTVTRAENNTFHNARVIVDFNDSAIVGVGKREVQSFVVKTMHSDVVLVENVPLSFKIVALSRVRKEVYGVEKENQLGIQFHIAYTKDGARVLDKFLLT